MEQYNRYLTGVSVLDAPQRTWGAGGVELVAAPVYVEDAPGLRNAFRRPSERQLGTRLVATGADEMPSPLADLARWLGVFAVFLLACTILF